jgi:hypothetical protein
MRRLVIVASVFLGAVAGAWPSSGASPPDDLNLYDWMGRAPVIVSGRALDASGKSTPVVVERVLRGEVAAGEVLPVMLKRANRQRDLSEHALKLEEGKSYLFLLRAGPSKRSGETTYDLVRGVRGAREVPAEGADAFLDAVERFARIQEQNNDLRTWEAFRRMLEETQPLLIRTALEEYLEFERGGPQLLALIRPLLAHPMPDLRTLALRLVDQILERHPAGQIPDPDSLEVEIVALARRDPSVETRVAATRALRGLPDPGITEVWQEISKDDPDQNVRYMAERLLYERSGEGRPPGGDEPSSRRR